MGNHENRAAYMVTIAIYTVIWWWLTGIFGLIASYGYSKSLDLHLDNGEKFDGRLLWVAFLESKSYWLVSLLISIGLGLLVGILGAM